MTKKILIVRNDRLGDTILALPSVTLLRELHPHYEIYFLTDPTIAQIIKLVNGIHEVVSDDTNNARLISKLKEINISTAFCLYPTYRNAINLFKASIPERVGTARRWYSLAFNKRLNISRRNGNRHEALLNLDLISPDRQVEEYPFPKIEIPEQELDSAEILLKDYHIDGKKPIVIIHPGSGLSAVNWHSSYFQALIKKLTLNSAVDVVITGIKTEEGLCGEVAVEGSVNLCGKTDLIGMAALINKSDLLISNSTGPLHLAVALGCKVIGLYPPKKDCLPERWGPYQHPEWAMVQDLPLCKECSPGKFSPCHCMEEITPESVYDRSLEMLRI